MKKTRLLLPILPISLVLASCNLLGLPQADVSGNILGTQPQGKIRLNLRGITVGGIQTPVLDQVNFNTFNPEKRVYAITLPEKPSSGGYELLAFVDTNENNRFDTGEQRTKTNTKNFVYSENGLGDKSGKDLLNLKPGWTLIDGLTPGKNGTPFTAYDLNW